MVQTEDMYNVWDDRRFEDEVSLKKYLRPHYNTIKTRDFSLGQTTTAAFVEIFEDSGETIAAPLTSNGTVLVWQKTDQVGTDANAVITVEYLDEDFAVQTVTTALDGTDTTTEVAVASDFCTIRKLTTSILAADEILLGTTGGAALYSVIKVGCWEAVQSRYTCPADARAFLVCVAAQGAHANASTYKIEFISDGATLKRVVQRNDLVLGTWFTNIYCLELEEKKTCIFYIKKNADANHATAWLRYRIIEAWNT